MTRVIGTTARGIRGPVVKQGDNLIKIVADSVMNAVKETNYLGGVGDAAGGQVGEPTIPPASLLSPVAVIFPVL